MTNLVTKSFEFTGRAGIKVHELVSIYKQSCFFALIFIFEGCETTALDFQNTGQVSDVALERQEPSPDLPETEPCRRSWARTDIWKKEAHRKRSQMTDFTLIFLGISFQR